jgi:hypothetical protein
MSDICFFSIFKGHCDVEYNKENELIFGDCVVDNSGLE